MSHSDIQTRLRDALADAFRGTGVWAYVVDVFGDDKSGLVVYSCEGDLKRAAYTIDGANTKIDTAAAVDVVPLTTYEVESEVEATEAGARNSKRDLKMLQAIHDSSASLGASCASPKEAAKPNASLNLIESAASVEPIVLKEARADYEIKLIAPGAGSSAFYPAEVLKRDGPKVFGSGTHVYLNHPTRAEEAQRPEGDVANLAGVLTTAAEYKENHAKGAGLYARMKVFADHAQMVEEKAAHVGMSIRASGIADGSRDGLPVLKQFLSAESVDVVTKAGAGGLILTEAARSAAPQGEVMDEKTTKLLESLVQQNAALAAKMLRTEAREACDRILAGVTMPDPAKVMVRETILNFPIPTTEAGDLNITTLTEAVNAEAKRVGTMLAAVAPGSRVTGMGAAAPVQMTEAERVAAKQREADDLEAAVAVYESLGMPKDAAVIAAKGR